MIVVKMQTQEKQTHLKNLFTKLSITLLLSKNSDRDTWALKRGEALSNIASFTLQKQIIIMKKTDHKREIRSQTP